MLWTDETSRDLILMFVADGYLIMHSPYWLGGGGGGGDGVGVEVVVGRGGVGLGGGCGCVDIFLMYHSSNIDMDV